MTDTLLTLDQIADRIGVTVHSARIYHQRAVRNRREGVYKTGDMPEPDRTFGRSPTWTEASIEKWLTQRPGRGIGGGRRKAA